MRRIAVVVITVAFALLGPRFTAPQDRAAGQPFVYEPPEGFTPDVDSGSTRDVDRGAGVDEGEQGRDKKWSYPLAPGRPVTPRIHLTLSKKKGSVEPADLAKIAEGMPAMLAENGVTWTDVRHETRTRADGARVGIIEGESSKTVEQAMLLGGGAAVNVRYRRLLFVFPTDEGAALTTAIYGKDEVAKWQPLLEATIDKAKGVALRVPNPPQWMYFAWGGAGLVLGWLASSLIAKEGRGKPKDPDESKRSKNTEDAEDAEDTEETADTETSATSEKKKKA